MRQLPLADVHREDARTFSKAWSLELPGSFGAGARREYAALGETVGLLDESYRGVIDFLGEDAGTFLDKVVSSPVPALEDRGGQDSCLLSAKGRLLGTFVLWRLSSAHFRAILCEPPRDTLLEGLRKYALLSDIEVRDVTAELSILALRGPLATPVLEAAGAAASPGVFEVSPFQSGGVSLDCAGVSRPGGYELWTPSTELSGLWARLQGFVGDADGLPVGWEASETKRIEAAIAAFGRDYDDDFFPAEVDEDHRLNYEKCYVGQEVVARMRTYGHANRKLFHLFSSTDTGLSEGSKVYCDSLEAGRVGTTCHSFAHSRPLALAMIQRKFFNSNSLHLEGGAPVEIVEPPGRGE